MTKETLPELINHTTAISNVVNLRRFDTYSGPVEGNFDFKNYWRIFLKFRNIIYACLLSSLLLSLIYAFTATPLYTAQSKLRISTYEPVLSATKIEDMLEQKSRENNYFDTQIQEISSFSLIDQILKDERIKAIVRPKSSGGIFAALTGKNQDSSGEIATENALESNNPASNNYSSADTLVSRLQPNLTYNSKFEELQSYLELVSIFPIRRTSLVNIQATLPDRELAAYVANKHASEYIDWIRFKRIEQQSRGLTFLKSQAEELKEKVSDIERELADYAETNSIIALNKDENITVQKMSQLNNLLTAATAKRIETENAYSEAEAALRHDSAGVDDNSVQVMRSELGKLEAEKQLLSTKFTASYPRIVQIDSQIKNIQKSIKEQRQQIVAGLKAKSLATIEEEKNLKEELEKQKSQAFELSKKQVNYNILNRELTTSRELLQNIISQIKETSIAVESNATNVTLVDPAVIPDEPSFPRKRLVLGIGLSSGLFLGIFLAIFLNYIDNSVRTLEDVVKTSQLPALGLVPSFEKVKPAPQLLVGSSEPSIPELDDSSELKNGESLVDPKAEVLGLTAIASDYIKNPRSLSSEAYRAIRTSLLLSQAGEPPKTILVTSAQPSEGKTTTALNLAASFSSMGSKVLIIDADLRRPKINKEFGIDLNDNGLVEALTGLKTLSDVIRKDLMPGLNILFSGTIPPNPAELLGSTSMKEIIEEASAYYDHIIIDSPPILPVTDSVVLSRYVDGVVLVMRAGVTPKRVIQDALEKLRSVGARILGAILNDVDTSRHEYQYYTRYYHSYYQSDVDHGSKAA